MRERKLNRLKGYDYSQNGAYFVTFNVKNFLPYFGKIENGKMILNEYGKIVSQQWLWLHERYHYITLDVFVVMPDHCHGILHITENGGVSDEKIKPLPELIGAFKTTSSKLIHRSGLPEFQWHKSFHDQIIRNGQALRNIRNYIINNPQNWEHDIENP
jgi:putative transposase